MKVMGIDIGFTTGFCHFDDDKWDMGQVLYEGKRDEFLSYNTAKEIEKIISFISPGLVVFEGYAYGGGFFNYYVPEITGQVKRFLVDLKTPFLAIAPNTMKMIVAGNGHATKGTVKREVKRLFLKRWDKNMGKISFHIADACMAFIIGYDFIGGQLSEELQEKFNEDIVKP